MQKAIVETIFVENFEKPHPKRSSRFFSKHLHNMIIKQCFDLKNMPMLASLLAIFRPNSSYERKIIHSKRSHPTFFTCSSIENVLYPTFLELRLSYLEIVANMP